MSRLSRYLVRFRLVSLVMLAGIPLLPAALFAQSEGPIVVADYRNVIELGNPDSASDRQGGVSFFSGHVGRPEEAGAAGLYFSWAAFGQPVSTAGSEQFGFVTSMIDMKLDGLSELSVVATVNGNDRMLELPGKYFLPFGTTMTLNPERVVEGQFLQRFLVDDKPVALGVNPISLVVGSDRAVTLVYGQEVPIAVVAFHESMQVVDEHDGSPPVVLSSTSVQNGSVGVRVVSTTAGSQAVDVRDLSREPENATPDFLLREDRISLGPASNGGQVINPVLVIDDLIEEPRESLRLELFEPSDGFTVGEQSVITLTIRDNDEGKNSRSDLRIQKPRQLDVENLGSLSVTLRGLDGPSDGGWRFSWELEWRRNNSSGVGTAVRNLEPGEYPIVFLSEQGFITPDPTFVAVTAGKPVSLSFTYQRSDSPQESGSIEIQAGGTVPEGARWYLDNSETGTELGMRVESVAAGDHTISFEPVDDWITPIPFLTRVFAGETSRRRVTYSKIEERFTRKPPPDDLPKTPKIITDREEILAGAGLSTGARPGVFNGQIRTETGWGSGFAVTPYVVLTAAHVVFNDVAKRTANHIEWFPHRHKTAYQPTPRQPAGVLLLKDYERRRLSELNQGMLPGKSGPLSQAEDVAALYFAEEVVRGGAGGFHLVESPVEEFGTVDISIVYGYPVQDLSASASDSRLFAPDFLHSIETVGPPDFDHTVISDKVCLTDRFVGFPGNSGGSFNIGARSTEGRGDFFPAGVYIANRGLSGLVRPIDQDVVELINLAASLAVVARNTGGDPVPGPPPSTISSGFGIVHNFQFLPAGVLAAGASAYLVRGNNAERERLGAGEPTNLSWGRTYRVEFESGTSGYKVPESATFVLRRDEKPPESFTFKEARTVELELGIDQAEVFVDGLEGLEGLKGRSILIESTERLTLDSRAVWTTFETLAIGPEGRVSVSISEAIASGEVQYFRARLAEQ